VPQTLALAHPSPPVLTSRYVRLIYSRRLFQDHAYKRTPWVRNRQEIDMRKFLLVSTLAFLAGTGLAAAQIADDPPGSAFQTQGIREYDGLRPTPSVFSRTARAAAAASAARAYASIPIPNGRTAERQARRAWATSRLQLSLPAQDARTGRSEWARCQSLRSRTACPFDVYD
jgi:hypothetical protein